MTEMRGEMREHKFRAWDEAAGVMTYSETDAWTLDEFGGHWGFAKRIGYSSAANGWRYREVKGMPVMDSLGMKDEAGNNLYQADIVRFMYDAERPLDHNSGTEMIDVIVYEDGAFWFQIKMGYGRFRSAYAHRWNNRCRRIGNIYENPELVP